MEGCKSNAIMRCCKDLGVASELWDPRFIRKFKKEYCTEQFGEHAVTKRKKKLWLRKGDSLEYPYVVSKYGSWADYVEPSLSILFWLLLITGMTCWMNWRAFSASFTTKTHSCIYKYCLIFILFVHKQSWSPFLFRICRQLRTDSGFTRAVWLLIAVHNYLSLWISLMAS